ncbi:MAG: DNA cytosine methyltransferase [Alphaproteobacteria bacterium]|nr:DNA cytosine methyltransferase [Alphaproteobacteria bacterium]
MSERASCNAVNLGVLLEEAPKVISLFSGCGGLDLGFHQAGFEVVYANDIAESVRETYEFNIGPIDIRDICEVDKATLPDCDVILAGVPCQPFSNAGNRGSMTDDRGVLFREVIKIVDLKNPKVVLFENVRGFLSSKDDEGVPMPKRIEAELKAHGYNLHYQLLNASDYEVPQNRYRVVMVGIREDLNKTFEFPEPIENKEKLTVKHVIGNAELPEEKKEVWGLSPQSVEIAKHIPEGGSWKNVPYELLPPRLKKIRDNIKKYRSPNFYRRFSRDEIMGTITAASTPENSGIIHPLELRRYSVREIARFQSFPDDFKFIGSSVSSKYKMIGNAVPVKLAYHIARKIKEDIFDES